MEEMDVNEISIDKGCVLIAEAGDLLKCNAVTICKGMLIYHLYQKVKNEYKSFFYLFATAALNLSIQVCEERIETDKVLEVFKSLGTRGKDEVPKEQLEQQLMNLQFDIYRVVFDRPYREAETKKINDELYCETAHKYVFRYLAEVASIPDVEKNLISIKTWMLKLILTFYHSKRCTYYDSLEIALAALNLAFHQYKINLKLPRKLAEDIYIRDGQEKKVTEKRIGNAMDDIVMVSDIGTRNAYCSLVE